jgi:Flp pilus assembly protein TadD
VTPAQPSGTQPSGEAGGLDRATAVEAIDHLLDVGRYDDARGRAAALLGQHPDDGHVLCLLARALLGVGDAAGALQVAQRSVAVGPDDEWAHRLVSVAFDRLGRPQLARDAARRATALAPNLWQGWVQLADTAQDVAWGEQEAVHAATQAIRLAPQEASPHIAYGRIFMRSNPAHARFAFEEALRRDPGNAAARNNLAVLDLRTSKFRRAGEGLIRAAAADPRNTVAQHNLRLAVYAIVGRACLAVVVFTLVLARPLLLLGDATGRLPVPFAIIWIVGEAVGLSFLAWWLRRLTPPLRRHLWYLIGRDPMLRVLVASLAVVGLLGTVGVLTWGPLGLASRVLTVLVVVAVRVLTGVASRRLRRGRAG